MEEMITEYLDNNYYVIFSTLHSYYCIDKKTQDKVSLSVLVEEVELIFGNIDEITTITYLWLGSKTRALREKVEEFESLYFQGLVTIEQINELVMAE